MNKEVLGKGVCGHTIVLGICCDFFALTSAMCLRMLSSTLLLRISEGDGDLTSFLAPFPEGNLKSVRVKDDLLVKGLESLVGDGDSPPSWSPLVSASDEAVCDRDKILLRLAWMHTRNYGNQCLQT